MCELRRQKGKQEARVRESVNGDVIKQNKNIWEEVHSNINEEGEKNKHEQHEWKADSGMEQIKKGVKSSVK